MKHIHKWQWVKTHFKPDYHGGTPDYLFFVCECGAYKTVNAVEVDSDK